VKTKGEDELGVDRDVGECRRPVETQIRLALFARRELGGLRRLALHPVDDDLVAPRGVERKVLAGGDDSLRLDDLALVAVRRTEGVHLDDVPSLHIRPGEVADFGLEIRERGNRDMELIGIRQLAGFADRSGQLGVNPQPIAEVHRLAGLAELLHGLDESVQSAAHVVELSTHVPGVEGVFDELIHIVGLAVDDGRAQKNPARFGVVSANDTVFEQRLIHFE